ncbi:MAG: molybdopterin converting factor subunit 1 [Gammaproteobacteria bacterium]|nr:molybdopterin converting factor subunit 1 [Gammaproteobacteria bacterium]
MQSITVRYFASTREKMGRGEERLEIQALKTAGDVWLRVAGEPPPANLLVAVNQEYVSLDAPVKDGDEVAFFPPVTGG